MPSDLAIDKTGILVQVRDRRGVDLPFSKGLMATSILATGIETGLAYAIAADIERELRRFETHEVGADELAELATRAIERSAGEEAAERYRACCRGNPPFSHLPMPWLPAQQLPLRRCRRCPEVAPSE
jgi:hypothetical protein